MLPYNAFEAERFIILGYAVLPPSYDLGREDGFDIPMGYCVYYVVLKCLIESFITFLGFLEI